MSLKTDVSLRIQAALASVLDLVQAQANLDQVFTLGLTTGVGLNQADQVFSDERTLTTAQSEDLDLSGTALQNALGVNIALVKLKLLLVVADPTNTTNITLQKASSNGVAFLAGTTPGFTLKPGGAFLIFDPSLAAITVTATTGDLINLTNGSGASAKYKIIVIGTTA